MKYFGRRTFCISSALLATVAALAAFADPPASPSPAPPTDVTNLRRVESFSHIAAFLNLAQGTVRLVAVLAVDHNSSSAAIDTVAAVIRGNTSKRLRAYVVLRGSSDSGLRPAALAGRAPDPRIVYFWDPNGTASTAWQSAKTPNACVWLYDTSARFVESLPQASLSVATPADRPDAPLDGPALRVRAQDLVRRVEAKVAMPDDGS